MSLEIALAANTEALREVAALLLKLGAMPGPGVVTPTDVPAKVKPAAKAPVAEPIAEATPAPVALTYDDVKLAVIAVTKAKGRDAAVALLAKFGAQKAPDLRVEQYAAVCAAAAGMLA